MKHFPSRWILSLGVLVIGIVLVRPIGADLRVISIVLRFSSPQSTTLGTRFAGHPIREETETIQSPWGPVRYHLYTPLNSRHYGGVVLVHGIHREGIEEPRLINFSRALAAAGVEVMTPEITDLANYSVTSKTPEVIGYSAEFLSNRMKRPKVGVIGLSFSGGLALIAAADPRYASKMGFVLALGGYSDLGRVARFLATDKVQMPDGTTRVIRAHEYGALVIAYSHVADFFPAGDITTAREALRLWLSEMPDQAWATARGLSPQGTVRFEELLHHRQGLRESLLRSIQLHGSEMEAVSPSGRLDNLSVPVYLLHAARDDVIPASETLWLSQEIPRNRLRAVLISPVIVHSDVGEEASLLQKWQLVTFLSRVLEEVDRLAD